VYQPYPSSGQSAEPQRPPAPAPVRTAVKLMYAGAAVWTVVLISALVLRRTAGPARPSPPGTGPERTRR
jgi:hypothetical protein